MKLSALACVPLAILAACATVPDNSALASKYAGTGTEVLWAYQATSASPIDLAFIEAELGTRGQTHSGSSYLGSRTASAYGRRLYSRETLGSSGGKDCSDFQSSAAAQRFFLASGGPVSDPHNLDRDGDGLACEWGMTLHQTANIYRKRASPSYRTSTYGFRPSSSATCYVGPRGGRYTITASGKKNYGGC